MVVLEGDGNAKVMVGVAVAAAAAGAVLRDEVVVPFTRCWLIMLFYNDGNTFTSLLRLLRSINPMIEPAEVSYKAFVYAM